MKNKDNSGLMNLSIIDKLINFLIALFMACIVLAVIWQVISRDVLSEPSAISGELSKFLLIWIGLLGAAYCYRNGSHLSLNIVTQKFAPHYRYATTILSHTIVLLFTVVVLIIGGSNLVLMTFESGQLSPVMGIKIGYVYSVLPLSGAVITIFSIDKIMYLLNTSQQDFITENIDDFDKVSANPPQENK